MEMIMFDSTQRERIRMRRDAEMDWRTKIRAAEKRGADRANLEVAKGLKQDGIHRILLLKTLASLFRK